MTSVPANWLLTFSLKTWQPQVFQEAGSTETIKATKGTAELLSLEHSTCLSETANTHMLGPDPERIQCMSTRFHSAPMAPKPKCEMPTIRGIISTPNNQALMIRTSTKKDSQSMEAAKQLPKKIEALLDEPPWSSGSSKFSFI